MKISDGISTSTQRIVASPEVPKTPPGLFSMSERAISFGGSLKGFVPMFTDYEEEELLEIMIQILVLCVEIYVRMPKTIEYSSEVSQSLVTGADWSMSYKLLVSSFH